MVRPSDEPNFSPNSCEMQLKISHSECKKEVTCQFLSGNGLVLGGQKVPKCLLMERWLPSSLTFPSLPFFSSASLLCLRPLHPWAGCLVQDLQHHLNAAPDEWEFFRGCAKISSAADLSGPGPAPESSCYFSANGYQVPLHFQPERLLQYLPSKCSCHWSWVCLCKSQFYLWGH